MGGALRAAARFLAELLFHHKVIPLLQGVGLLSEERTELLLSWRHTGFSVHNRVRVERHSGVTSPEFGGIGPRSTPTGLVRQARGAGLGENGRGTFEEGEGKFLSVSASTAFGGDPIDINFEDAGLFGIVSPTIFQSDFAGGSASDWLVTVGE